MEYNTILLFQMKRVEDNLKNTIEMMSKEIDECMDRLQRIKNTEANEGVLYCIGVRMEYIILYHLYHDDRI